MTIRFKTAAWHLDYSNTFDTASYHPSRIKSHDKTTCGLHLFRLVLVQCTSFSTLVWVPVQRPPAPIRHLRTQDP